MCTDRGRGGEHVSVVEGRKFVRWAPSVRNGSDVIGALGDFDEWRQGKCD